MSGEQHVDAHEDGRGPREDAGDGEPHEEVSSEALGGAGGKDGPGAPGDGGGEDTGEDAGVGANVLEEGDRVEGGLVVALARLEERRVYAEAVGRTSDALDPRARRQRRPLAPPCGSGRRKPPPHRLLSPAALLRLRTPSATFGELSGARVDE